MKHQYTNALINETSPYLLQHAHNPVDWNPWNENVLAKAKELTGKDVEVKNIVDESILGGFILRVGDKQYNASIANKLNNLKREFTLN